MLVVPRNCLPDDDRLRQSVLRKLFPHQVASCALWNDGWNISLQWPNRPEEYIDPRLQEGLRWWSPELLVEQIPTAFRKEGNWDLSLSDAWALYSWSRWLATRGAPPERVVLLHVDEHDDLMTPHVWAQSEGWQDPFTLHSIDLLKPDSIHAALHSGAIGMESFMVPLAYWIPNLHIRHLRATANPAARVRRLWLKRTLLEDSLLGKCRPAVRPNTSDTGELSQEGVVEYVSTRHLDAWLADLPEGPLFLHLDLDYCSNRYNGNSDWKTNSWGHDPDLVHALRAIDDVFKTLADKDLLPQIENVTSALSPGFFPAEFWSAAVERLREHLSAWGPKAIDL